MSTKYPIIVVDYDPRWTDLYQEEVAFLRSRLCPDVLIRTQHFGSTAIPGLASKPVIDVLVEIPSFQVGKRQVLPALENEGYAYMWRSDRPPGHMMFVKGYGKDGYAQGVQLYHLHMAPGDHPLWERLLFRDYLRNDPATAQRYEDLKYRLARQHPHDREAYTDGKAAFVAEIMERAKAGLDSSKELGSRTEI